MEKLAQLGRRRVILFPDGDAFEEWSKLAHQTRMEGLDVHVSDLLETELTDDQKRSGWDLADYFLSPQLESFTELSQVTDEQCRYELDERAAILKFDAGCTHEEAEARAAADFQLWKESEAT